MEIDEVQQLKMSHTKANVQTPSGNSKD